ncbi:STOP protein (macronuclear) [Tetrahymena thermophila SB210]|uniref:STOP protein n=1 Tax=Tetrahymena thermophila (strain SB210) TaxID=312017 RepID=I7MMW4_TETTS|nr:STOP protein [Tetrahymena thermophila SB210]EAS07093.1 STOP protein [Tetrahymena thermophila SB210]|eukprot:XP_001027335.1 STOP protein [Tetrahymena thermophila SB210]
MKRTVRSISQNQPRCHNVSFDQEDQEFLYQRENQFIPQKYKTNQATADRRSNSQQQQYHHPMRTSSQGEFSLGDRSHLQYIQETKPSKDSNKTNQHLKFEKGKLIKQVEGNQHIKGFDLNNLKQYTDQLRQQRQLPAVQKSYDSSNSNQHQIIEKFVDKKDSIIKNVNKKIGPDSYKKYSNIDQLLSILNKTQKEKDLEVNASAAQNQRIKLAKINKNVNDKSFSNSDQKGQNRLDDTQYQSPSRAVKTESYDYDYEQGSYPRYSSKQIDDSKISPVKFQHHQGSASPTDQCCPAKAQNNKLDTKLKQFMNQYDEYYKHIKGECLCYRCICGGCRCDAKEPKLDKPMKQNKTNYELNYYKKPTNTDNLRFDMNNYNNEVIPKDPKFTGNTTQKIDYQNPGQIEQTGKIVPKDNIIQGPPIQWVTSYNRNFINFGNVPTFNQQKGQDRTTSDKMKFIDGTTYDRFYNKKDNSPQQKFDAFIPQSSLDYALKNPKPFIGDTTHNHFYKPHKIDGVQKKWDQNDHLLTGVPSHLGQYDTNHNKEYGEKNRICPAKIEKQELLRTKREQEKQNLYNSQKELVINNTGYGNMSVDFK